MDLHEKIRTLPTDPGVYMYQNAEGEVIYVGKANNLRSRVRSYFLADALLDEKTGSLMREAVDIEYIVVANNHEALALENNLIKQKKPRFNILLRDDKTYPYIKLTKAERFPRVFVTRRLKKDGSVYYGPYFPGNLAHRIVDLIHRHFLIPSCKLDLTRFHSRPCLQYYIKRCLGPCVKDLTTSESYGEAVRDVEWFLDGRQSDLAKSLEGRMGLAAANEQYELAAKYRDLIVTVHELHERQRIAAAEGDDADVFGFHYENDMVAVNLFHLRGGQIVDRREFFWEELPNLLLEEDLETTTADLPAKDAVTSTDATTSTATTSTKDSFTPGPFFSALLKQIYLDQQYIPKNIYAPVEFTDRKLLEEVLSEKRAAKIEILVPQRGEKRALIDLAAKNAKMSYDQRFRTLKPTAKMIREALQEALTLPELPKRIECFDISHIQGAETVASMVVWEEGKMQRSEYRKFIIRSVEGVDDFASMREVVERRYKRILSEKKKMPSLVLIDGGIGQLHAAADALNALELTSQPLASIAKKEEIIYVHGQEDEPILLDHHSPVLHLVQMIRDESHRFAVTFHRKRRQIRDRSSELLRIPGVGERTTRRLVEHFGSVRAIKRADPAALAAVVTGKQAKAILEYFERHPSGDAAEASQ